MVGLTSVRCSMSDLIAFMSLTAIGLIIVTNLLVMVYS